MERRAGGIRERLLATFRVEAEEHLQALRASLMALERDQQREERAQTIEAAFREMHTLKGAARSVALTDVETVCQACESLLSRLAHNQLALSPPIRQTLRQAIEAIGHLVAGPGAGVAVAAIVAELEQTMGNAGAEAPLAAPNLSDEAAASRPATATAGEASTVRLSTDRLDALFAQAEELLAAKLAAEERVAEAKALAGSLAQCRAALRQGRPAAGETAGGADGPLRLPSDLAAVETAVHGLLAGLIRDQRAVALAVDGLQEKMRLLRMAPASTVLDLFPWMVQDLARGQKKEVRFAAEGDELELDRRVLEGMKDPLIHLVRNAVDHGIEPPEARAAAGKPAPGSIAVRFSPVEGSRIEIRVEDDGAGVDLQRVRTQAERGGLLGEGEAEALPDEEILNLIFRAGFSTSPIITDISGHGFGLAIVKEHVDRLGGRIEVQTRAGAGTAARVTVPATIATFRGLLVQAGHQPFLLPTDAVERAIRFHADQVEHVEGHEAISHDGRPLLVGSLARLLGIEDGDGPPEGGHRLCVVVRAGRDAAGLVVDEIAGEREVLVKELQPPLLRVRHVASAGLLGTGQVVLILRPEDLIRSLGEARRPAAGAVPQAAVTGPPAVLVVDDSITTRTMEKNLLEAAGYRVRVAVDGMEAWTLLRSESFDLVVSDVDMPRLDGFDLTARIRADRKLADLPVVLVTALESREDRERGIDVGANAYLVKSSFDQSNLLEIIRRLV